jgi:hypothetical protein
VTIVEGKSMPSNSKTTEKSKLFYIINRLTTIRANIINGCADSCEVDMIDRIIKELRKMDK